MSIDEIFANAVKVIKEFKQQPTNEEKLTLYQYYKQATVGDINIPQPGYLEFTAKAKWNAWNSVKGMTYENAKIMYIKTVSVLTDKYD